MVADHGKHEIILDADGPLGSMQHCETITDLLHGTAKERADLVVLDTVFQVGTHPVLHARGDLVIAVHECDARAVPPELESGLSGRVFSAHYQYVTVVVR